MKVEEFLYLSLIIVKNTDDEMEIEAMILTGNKMTGALRHCKRML